MALEPGRSNHESLNALHQRGTRTPVGQRHGGAPASLSSCAATWAAGDGPAANGPSDAVTVTVTLSLKT